MSLYGHCGACCPGMGGVSLLCCYSLLVYCYYVIVDVVLVIHPTIVFEAIDLVVDVLSAALLFRVTVVDYSKYISLSVFSVVQRKFNWFWFMGIVFMRIHKRVRCWVEVRYQKDRVNVLMWGKV